MSSEPRLVLVDAEKHARAIKTLLRLEGDFDLDGKTRLAEAAADAADDLAPVLPELPEDCREVERSAAGLRVMRNGTVYGISGHGTWNDRMGVGHWTPNDIAQYLLAHWAAKETT